MNKFIISSLLFLSSLSHSAFAQGFFGNPHYIDPRDIEDIALEIKEQHNFDMNIVVLDIDQSGDRAFINNIAQKPDKSIYFATVFSKNTNLDGHQAPGCTIFIDQKNNRQFALVQDNYKDYAGAKDFTRFFLTAHELGHCLSGMFGQSANSEPYADFFTLYFLNNSEHKVLIPAWIQFLSTLSPSHNNHKYILERKDKIMSAKSIKEIQQIFLKYK